MRLIFILLKYQTINNKIMNSGELHITVGSMFSGKTSALIELYNNLRLGDINVVAINYAEDKRYSENLLSTHDQVMIKAINVINLSHINLTTVYSAQYKNAKYILINEAQFFDDLYDFVIMAVEKDKKFVYVYGLDGDFQRDKFGQLVDLIPYCNTITKLHANCQFCKETGIFSHRINSDKRQKIIGSSNYVSLCRNCYLSKNKDNKNMEFYNKH